MDRAHTEGSKQGYCQGIYKRNGQILGATIISPQAGELINEWALAIARGLKLSDIAKTLHVYPTYGMSSMQLAAEVEIESAFSGTSGWFLRKLARTG